MAKGEAPVMILSDQLLSALRDAGITPERTRRVVIDIQMRHFPMIHIEQYGDNKLLSVIRALDGIEISREERDHPEDAP
jgi:hypothetical protein